VSYSGDKHHGGKEYYLGRNEENVRLEIFTNGPVVAGYTVYQDFYSYKGGVYHHVTGAYAGGHAVKIIGWGTENGVPYWLVANSWGPDWGPYKGFFKIRRGNNECDFEAGICAATMSSGSTSTRRSVGTSTMRSVGTSTRRSVGTSTMRSVRTSTMRSVRSSTTSGASTSTMRLTHIAFVLLAYVAFTTRQ